MSYLSHVEYFDNVIIYFDNINHLQRLIINEVIIKLV
jgi:hypothetical protein